MILHTNAESPPLANDDEEDEDEPIEQDEPYDEDEDDPVLIEPDEDEEDDELEPAEYDESQLTPQGRFRSSVTEADDFEYMLPPQSVLLRSRGKETVDTAGQQRTGKQLVEALGHFGVEAKVVGTVAGPHVTR